MIALVLLQKTAGELLGDLGDLFFRRLDDGVLLPGDLHIENGRRERRVGGILVAAFLDGVKDCRSLGRIARLEARLDDLAQVLLADGARPADELGGKLELQIIFGLFALDEAQILRHAVVVDDAADRRLDDARHGEGAVCTAAHEHMAADAVICNVLLAGEGALVGKFEIVELARGQLHRATDIDLVLAVGVLELIAHERLVEGGEHGRFVHFAVLVGTALRVVLLALLSSQNGEVIRADDHVLRGAHDRLAVGELQNVVRREHEETGFRLRLDAEGKVHCHLVAVEVGVEGAADEGRDLDGAAFDEHGLKRLNGEAVQRGRTVQEHGVILDDFFENVPDEVLRLLDGALGALDVMALVGLDEPLHHEGFEQLDGHLLRETALIDLELGADDDDRTAGVVDTLAEEVLTEATLLAAKEAGERLEFAVGGTGERLAAAAVVDEGIDGFLQHALLVLDDHLGCAEFDHALQAVVAVDDAAVEVIEIGGCKPAAVQLHHGAQVGGNDGKHGEDHPLGAVAALAEGLDDLDALDRLDALGPGGVVLDDVARLLALLLEVDRHQKFTDGLGTHAHFEAGLGAVPHRLFEIAELLVVDDLLVLETRRAGIEDDVCREIDDLLERLGAHVKQQPDLARDAAEVPDVRDGSGELDVTHALAAHLGARHFDAALLADDALVADALIFAAVAFPVLGGAEDLLAEEAVALGLLGAVVDGLGFGHFAVRPFPDLFGRCHADLDGVKIV